VAPTTPFEGATTTFCTASTAGADARATTIGRNAKIAAPANRRRARVRDLDLTRNDPPVVQ
jgi:hypothetical protein